MAWAGTRGRTRASRPGGLEREGDDGTFTLPALHFDPGTPSLHQSLHDRKTEPRAARGGREARLEDARELGGGNAAPIVFHRNDVAFDANADQLRASIPGILQQIDQRFLHLVR